MTDKGSGRYIVFDYMRLICTLWIVGIWHIIGYLSDRSYYNVIATPFKNQLTYGVLATFTFISGYLAYRNYDGIKSIFYYYIKKLVRLYPFFVLSCISLVLMRRMPMETLLPDLVGLGWIIQPFPTTVWFAGMIMIFYLLNPFISVKPPLLSCIISTLIWTLFFVFNAIFGTDERMWFYWIYFVMGSFCHRFGILEYARDILTEIKCDCLGEKNTVISCKSRLSENPVGGGKQPRGISRIVSTYMLLGSIPAFIFIANSIGNVAITRRTFFSCLYFIVALYLICEILSRCTKKIYPIIKAGSYASMAAYLFHRAVYFALTLLNGHKYLDVRVAYTAALPAVFIIGYFIQWSYDELINNFRKVKGIHGI